MPKIKALITATVAAVFLFGCAAPVQRITETRSGKPEGLFVNRSAADVSNEIVQRCAGRQGYFVASATSTRVECRGALDDASALKAQILMGNAYSTTPEGIAVFTLVSEGQNTRVYIDAFIETIMAFGQPRRVNLTDNDTYNQGLQLLWRMGARKPA